MSLPTQPHDRQLLDALRAGGEGAEPAFRVVYDRYARRIFAYSLKALRCESRARDITQDVFLRLLQSVQSNTAIENLPAFLLRICRNLCLNVRRDERLTYVDPETMDIMDADGETPEQRDIKEHVNKAIERLPELYREALLLQMYAGLSYAEICEVTGETLPTIRNRISRAKQKLRTILLPLLAE